MALISYRGHGFPSTIFPGRRVALPSLYAIGASELEPIRGSAVAHHGRTVRTGPGRASRRLPGWTVKAAFPPPEPARKVGKSSPSPADPQAPQPTKALLLMG